MSTAKYAILGAIIGDAAGTTFEFMIASKAKTKLANYHNLKNGLVGLGPFDVQPGQFTDDTEMALAIMSIIKSTGSYDQKLVAKAYYQWYLSNPPDIGRTTSNAVSKESASEMINVAKTLNIESLSNGFLMRLFGLVALYTNKSREELLRAIVLDVKLTHGHPETSYIAMIYGTMLDAAIRGQDATNVYLIGKHYCNTSELIKTIYHAVDNSQNYFNYNYYQYKLSDVDNKFIGFVGYAFWLLLLSLKNHKSYETAILDIISRGGDTDTNACIVGAVIGAIYPNTIPKSWIQSVTSFNAEKRFQRYPIANPKIWTKWLVNIKD